MEKFQLKTDINKASKSESQKDKVTKDDLYISQLSQKT